jgi:hypothetical protein
MEASIARERSYAQYATIGDVSYTLREQYSDQEITNLHPEFGPIFRKLEIVVPLSVSQAGEYQVTVEYLFEKDKVSGGTRMKSTTRAFEAKDHTVRFEFLANESRGNYGYWEPAAVEGKVEVQLLYSASKSGVSNRGQTAMKLVQRQKVEPAEQKTKVKDPQYNQDYSFPVYKIEAQGKTIKFATGEFSNGVWGFYVLKDLFIADKV